MESVLLSTRQEMAADLDPVGIQLGGQALQGRGRHPCTIQLLQGANDCQSALAGGLLPALTPRGLLLRGGPAGLAGGRGSTSARRLLAASARGTLRVRDRG